jgi:F0F1-type ATP synthase assembly protein I
MMAGRRTPGGQNAGWSIFGYLISGMAFYGGLGWLIDHWTGHSLFFPIGMLAGLAVSIGLIIHRYGRS